MDDEILTIQEKHIDAGFGDLWKQGVGAKISISDALYRMLAYSDNTAANLIAELIPQEDFMNVFEGLDLELNDKNGILSISAKGYASILKALYFSGIINRDHSERILQILSETPFDAQIRAGVPKSVVVSHKIGVYGEIYQDCGIVYEPNRPYLLCMVSKSNEEMANARMSQVSREIYRFIHTFERDP